MSLDPLERLIAAEREHPPTPTPRQAKAVWRRVQNSLAIGVVPIVDVPSLDLSTVTASASPTAKIGAWLSTSAAKITLAVTVAGTTTAATVAVVSQRSEDHDVAAVVERRTDHAHAPRSAHEPDPELAQPVPEPIEEARAALEAHHGQSRAAAPSPAAKRKQRPPRASTGQAPAPAMDASAAGDLDGDEERSLITRAQSALRRGALTETLALVDQHARRFPASDHEEEREALRVLASCRRGHEDGRRARDAFMARWPDSLYERRISIACE